MSERRMLRQRVEALYFIYPQPRSFEEDERYYRLSGHVIETRDVFVMGKAVKNDAPWEAIVEPSVVFARHVQDAWFIHAMAGSLRAMWGVMPYYLPLIGWARRGGRIKWHWLEDTHEAINHLVPAVNNFRVLTHHE